MPVLVTGAEAGLGRAVVARMLRTGGEVRVYLDPDRSSQADVDGYRRSGLKVARGMLEDEGHLELALAQVHTVVHAGGGALDDPATVLDDVASVVSAAMGAGCRRLVWASQLGASATEENPYLRVCAEAEALLADAPLETVVLRRALTYGPHDALTGVLAAGVPGADTRARHAPLYVDDLAAAVLAADAERGRTGPDHLLVSLAGPEVVTLERLVAGLAGLDGLRPRDPRGPADPPSAGPEAPAPAPHLADVLSRDRLPDATTLGRTGTPLAEGLARTRAATS